MLLSVNVCENEILISPAMGLKYSGENYAMNIFHLFIPLSPFPICGIMSLLWILFQIFVMSIAKLFYVSLSLSLRVRERDNVCLRLSLPRVDSFS